MKKPNVSEASEEFSQLAKSLNTSGLHIYSGYCCLTAARYEMILVYINVKMHLGFHTFN